MLLCFVTDQSLNRAHVISGTCLGNGQCEHRNLNARLRSLATYRTLATCCDYNVNVLRSHKMQETNCQFV